MRATRNRMRWRWRQNGIFICNKSVYAEKTHAHTLTWSPQFIYSFEFTLWVSALSSLREKTASKQGEEKRRKTDQDTKYQAKRKNENWNNKNKRWKGKRALVTQRLLRFKWFLHCPHREDEWKRERERAHAHHTQVSAKGDVESLVSI